jgi:hypothetical protein
MSSILGDATLSATLLCVKQMPSDLFSILTDIDLNQEHTFENLPWNCVCLRNNLPVKLTHSMCSSCVIISKASKFERHA